MPVDVIYLDFKKAFDVVPHERLMLKVRALSIDGNISKWIESWLKDRKQRVIIDGVCSDWIDVYSGIPQGSILGSMLLTIFINDI